MGSLADLLVTFLDLLEAEGRAFRTGLVKVGVIVALLGLVAILLVAGFGLILWAIYLYLRAGLPAAPAALADGIIAILVAGVLIWLSRSTAK